MIQFSIVIPLYNSVFVYDQLQTFAAQNYSYEDFEIVYIDDGSEISFQHEYQKIFLLFPALNISYHFFGDKNGRFRVQEARNRGVEYAKNEDIIFVDADCLLPYYYLQNFSELVKKYRETVILGWSVGYNHREDAPSILPEDIVEKKYKKYLQNEIYRDFRLPLTIDALWKVCIGGNLYIKKQVLSSIGGWDNLIASWGGGDIDVGFRLYKAGYQIKFLEGIEVYNIKDAPRISRAKFLSFMKNQCYMIEKYKYDSEYFQYVLFRYRYTPIKYKIGNMPSDFQKIFFPQKNILLFCSSSSGMGHFMRTLKIYHSLSRKYQVKIVIEGKIAEAFLEGVDYIYIQKGEFSSGDKEKIQEKYFGDFLPDYFLVDFFPFGKFSLKADIDFCIEFTQENNGKVFTYMRDVFNGISTITSDRDILSHRQYIETHYNKIPFQNLIERSYEKQDMKYLSEFLINSYIEHDLIDGVLFFGDNSIYDITKEYDFSSKVLSKSTFLGYILSGDRIQSHSGYSKQILVSSGGMMFHPKAYIKLLKILTKLRGFEIHFFPGNDMSDAEKEKWKNICGNPTTLHIHSFSAEYYIFLAAADIVFFCGGYNSFCDMIQYKKYTAVLGKDKENPKYTLDISESSTRVQAFLNRGYFKDMSEFSSQDVLRFIQEFYNGEIEHKRYDVLDTKGYDAILKFIDNCEQKNEI